MTDQHEKDSPGRDGASSEEREGRPKSVITSDVRVAIADPTEDRTQGVPETAKVMQIGTMIKRLLEEVKAASLDEAARDKLAELHERSVNELKGALSDALAEEIDRIVLPLAETPSEAEIRVSTKTLIRCLVGLSHTLTTDLVA